MLIIIGITYLHNVTGNRCTKMTNCSQRYCCTMIALCLLFSGRQEQCSVLTELMRQFQTLKTSISSVIESTEPLVDISSVLKDHEETRRSLTKVRLNWIFFYLIFFK